MATRSKIHITKAVPEEAKVDIADAAKAEGKTESAYLAGLIRYADDYLAYRDRVKQQIETYGELCAEWVRDMLALRDAGESGTTQEYVELLDRLLQLERVEKSIGGH